MILTSCQAQSLFYVLYLFPFTHGAPSAEPVYPARQIRKPTTWPACIRDWTDGSSLLRLGGHKDGFFAYDPDWLTEGFDGSVLPYWLTASPERDTLRELLLALHDKVLWLRNRTGPPFTCLQNPNATIEHVRKVLETFICKAVVDVCACEVG